MEIKTRFLIISDTHGKELPPNFKFLDPVDVAIHCGDLTTESKLDEFKAAIRLLKEISSPLKLVIAGNHDFTLDIPVFQKKAAEVKSFISIDEIKATYGDFGAARQLFYGAEDSGIVLLDEGTRQFSLANGALLTIYSSPYTPCYGDWGFQYDPNNEEHEWAIEKGSVDVVVTHGPPHGIMDYTHSHKRAGSTSLFGAIARARPKLHCFGHIHEGWGAKLVTWQEKPSNVPSHFTDIDNDRSIVIERLASLKAGKLDSPETINEKAEKLRGYTLQRACMTSHSAGDSNSIRAGTQTLFVNAAIQGTREQPFQLPWVVDIGLPRAS